MSSSNESPKKLTVELIAQELGISATTVSRALSGKGRVSAQTRARVLEYVGRSDYETSPLARRQEARATHNLAFVIPSHFVQLDLPFLRKCMGGVCRMAAQRGYDVLLCYADPQDTVQLERQLRAHKVDGVILSRTLDVDPCLELVNRYRMPYVAMGRLEDENALQMDNDQVGAAREMTTLLLQTGARRIAYIGGSMRYTVNSDRMQGYLRALTEYGITPDRKIICPEVESRDQVSDVVENLLNQYPDCILCGDDSISMTVLAYLQEHGISVPGQIRLASLYDSESLLISVPNISAAQFDAARLGVQACRMLLDSMEGREVIRRQVQGYQIVLRDSTK